MRYKNLILFLIIFTGLTIRLAKINQPLLEFFPPRQTQTAEITRNIYVNGWPDFWTPKVRYFTNSPIPYVLEFPLYNGIIVILYHLSISSPAAPSNRKNWQFCCCWQLHTGVLGSYFLWLYLSNSQLRCSSRC